MKPCLRCKKLERELREAREVLVRWHKLMFPEYERRRRRFIAKPPPPPAGFKREAISTL